MTEINFKIYHNPRCSNSRNALEIIKSKTKDCKIIKYLEDRIDIVELKSILRSNKISKEKIIRTNENFYKKLKLQDKDLSIDETINYIKKFPILLQRPLIFKYEKNKLIQLVIGRSSEMVMKLFR